MTLPDGRINTQAKDSLPDRNLSAVQEEPPHSVQNVENVDNVYYAVLFQIKQNSCSFSRRMSPTTSYQHMFDDSVRVSNTDVKSARTVIQQQGQVGVERTSEAAYPPL